MARKLSWQEIKQQYDGEWVQLIDFDWDITKQNPACGVVKVHSKDKSEFKQLIKKDKPAESAFLYVGKRLLPEGHIFAGKLQQFAK